MPCQERARIVSRMPQDDRAPTPPRPQGGATGDPPAPTSPLAGLAVGIGLLALVALPAAWAGYFALVFFTGCFAGCWEPEPLTGALLAGVALWLLAFPVLAGLVWAGVRRPRAWFLVAAAVTLLAVAWFHVQGLLIA